MIQYWRAAGCRASTFDRDNAGTSWATTSALRRFGARARQSTCLVSGRRHSALTLHISSGQGVVKRFVVPVGAVEGAVLGERHFPDRRADHCGCRPTYLGAMPFDRPILPPSCPSGREPFWRAERSLNHGASPPMPMVRLHAPAEPIPRRQGSAEPFDFSGGPR